MLAMFATVAAPAFGPLMIGQAFATSCPIAGGEDGDATTMPMIYVDDQFPINCTSTTLDGSFYDAGPLLWITIADWRFVGYLPDSAPRSGATHPALFAIDSTSDYGLVFDHAFCSGATISGVGTKEVSIALEDGESCKLYLFAGGYEEGFVDGTLARGGEVYSLITYHGKLTGGEFGGGFTAPEIDVQGNGVHVFVWDTVPSILDHTDFGSTKVSGGTLSRTFTIINRGDKPLVLGADAATLSGANASDFAVTSQPAETVLPFESTTVTIEFDPSAEGVRTTDLSIANDDRDESPYTFVIQGTGAGSGSTAPEIEVTGHNKDITDGDTTPRTGDRTDFGSADVSGDSVSRTFTITNSGDGTLTLGTNAVSVSGDDADDFSITSQPDKTVAASGGTTTFTVKFNPSATGTRSATVSIANDDSDESPFTFAIEGTGAVTADTTGTITIKLDIDDGPDTSLALTSDTSAFNFTLHASNGSAKKTRTGIDNGTHRVTAADLSDSGYSVTGISCSDDDSRSNVASRTAIIKLDAGESVTCTFALTGPDGVTSQMISDYLGTRNGFVLNNQPDPNRRIERLNGGGGSDGTASVSALGFTASLPSPVSVSIANNRLSYAASASDAAAFLDARTGDAEIPDIGSWDIWAEGRFDLFTDNASQSGTFGIAHFGADTLVSGDILLGLKLQVDWMQQSFTATSGTVTGLGAMAGPYATIALGENFYLDVSGMWGMSANDISPFGTYTDRFWSSRYMLDASLAGQFEIDNWTIRPMLAASYIGEDQQAYIGSGGSTISAQTVAQGQVSFAPRISYDVLLEDGATLTPWVEASGHYAIQTAGSIAAGTYASVLLGLSGRLGGGLDLMLPSGVSLAIAGNYGGIGTSAHSYGANIGLNAPIN